MSTPQEIYQLVRDLSNEQDTAFIGQQELYTYLWMAECALNRDLLCYELTDSSIPTVALQQEYSKPTAGAACFAIKRLLYNSDKLKKITIRQLDDMDSAGGTSSTGTPIYYYEYGTKIGLYPTPTEVKTLKFYFIGTPTALTSSSTMFSVPAMFHPYLADYALWRIFAKDQDEGRASFHKKLWDENMVRAKDEWFRTQRMDRHQVVIDADSTTTTDEGIV